MSHDVPNVFSVSHQNVQQLQKMAELQDLIAVESEEDFEQYIEISPFAIYQRFRPLQEIRSTQSSKTEQSSETKEAKVLSVEEVEQAAARFEKKNDELKSRTLLILRSGLTDSDSPLEILNKVLRVYPDHALADEALEFLSETTQGDLKSKIEAAKADLNRDFEREIKAGRNMGAQAREFSKDGLGSPTSLRDLYRDIINTPREPLKLFEELSDRYQYNKLKLIIRFLLHSLGADLRSKGPSISHAELKRLVDEIRSLQGIFGVFRFFQGRMNLVQKQFLANHLLMPIKMSFELLAKIFIKLLAERFVNPEKILQYGKMLGISEEEVAQIIIFTQFRDAVRQVSPRYYRNQKHQEDLLKSLLDVLEQLEDELEEDEEENEEKE